MLRCTLNSRNFGLAMVLSCPAYFHLPLYLLIGYVNMCTQRTAFVKPVTSPAYFFLAFCSAVLFEKDKSVIHLLHELAPVEEV